ncbi:aldo/keto reductase [Cupriavidus malaysiensis]|uniref:Aldo/keto reductase n=1 Tax=Cupriavidus malaysiensis TaxID=367825 RepID=A0A1D9I6B4_9BURK|nr:aldo/keto reductase [Cupriavidus malaysiensis]AOZ07573.1 aldo/keto reductase [Cupriavidus malaysiensis]
MQTVILPGGEAVPALGMGTWNMGEDPGARTEELAALRLGLDLGMTLIDTAEMYGEGRSEQLVGEAVAGRRDGVFLVSKVYPHHAGRREAVAACERSLRRLGTDRIDLYLLHWRGQVPLAETMEAFLALRAAGKIRHFGVSNLDLDDMQELWTVPGGRDVAANQLLYNLGRRGIEWDLLPWLREHQVPLMAYSPLEQARLLRRPSLAGFATRHGITPAQAALAWLLARPGVIAIPKSANRARVRDNAGALALRLDAAQLAELDTLFVPPAGPSALAMI